MNFPVSVEERLEISYQETMFRDRLIIHKFLVAMICGIINHWKTDETRIQLDQCFRPVKVKT